jgi:hypothetical protein
MTVATKASAGLKYLGIKGPGRCQVLGLSVQRPVPVAAEILVHLCIVLEIEGYLRLTTSVSAFFSQSLLVSGNEVTVPEDEMSL